MSLVPQSAIKAGDTCFISKPRFNEKGQYNLWFTLTLGEKTWRVFIAPDNISNEGEYIRVLTGSTEIRPNRILPEGKMRRAPIAGMLADYEMCLEDEAASMTDRTIEFVCREGEEATS